MIRRSPQLDSITEHRDPAVRCRSRSTQSHPLFGRQLQNAAVFLQGLSRLRMQRRTPKPAISGRRVPLGQPRGLSLAGSALLRAALPTCALSRQYPAPLRLREFFNPFCSALSCRPYSRRRDGSPKRQRKHHRHPRPGG
jgi:hypothetical protein